MKTFWGNQAWLKAAVFHLRYLVFVEEQGIALAEEFDVLDDDQRIYGLILEKNEPIATIRFQLDSPTQLHPDRFCAAKNFRNQGIGKQLFLELEAKGRAAGCKTSILSAEVSAQAFYQKLGYQIISEPFYEDGILCVKMKKEL